jgi:adenylate kinase family enzyme
MKKVILLTGPGGAGKSTIAELIEKECGYIFIDGDQEDTEFFPNGNQWLPENSENLKKAHTKILNTAKKLVDEEKKVVIDYIIFGQYLDFFKSFSDEFGDDLQIIVLFPEKTEIIDRDKKRECWTTGEERINAVYSEFEEIKNVIGKDKFIDTTGQTAEETLDIIKNV